MNLLLKFAAVAALTLPTFAQALSFAPLINPSEKCQKVYDRYVLTVSRSWDLSNQLIQFDDGKELSKRDQRRIARLERKIARLNARAQRINKRVQKHCEGSF